MLETGLLFILIGTTISAINTASTLFFALVASCWVGYTYLLYSKHLIPRLEDAKLKKLLKQSDELKKYIESDKK